jgi:hypothetical protein
MVIKLGHNVVATDLKIVQLVSRNGYRWKDCQSASQSCALKTSQNTLETRRPPKTRRRFGGSTTAQGKDEDYGTGPEHKINVFHDIRASLAHDAFRPGLTVQAGDKRVQQDKECDKEN